ncbi:MAG: biotin transporter BioY [Trueperaceae bacterium]|jgi:biotin transport system substrate-specific component|nr:biotin transporter BioY [Trueperaceae bacterium]|tara:strand:- start:379 stop:972 length:594 start_codon:yes stop_codon:yes gene_type:complete
MAIKSLSTPLVHRLVPIQNGLIRTTVQVIAGVVFLALLAQVRFDIGPVPITGQTLGILLIGASYGFSLGTLTATAYLIVGGLGLGVFSGGAAGWATFAGATGGYLIGFPIAAAVIGYLMQRGWHRFFFLTALAMFIGNLLIYVPGLLWLNRFAPDGSWPTTLAWGLTPFIAGDLIKLIAAAGLFPDVWRLVGQPRKS